MIEHEGQERIQRGISELGVTEWGFRVTHMDLELMGTKWDAAIHEAISPAFHHFARAGAAAVAASLSRGNMDGTLRDVFETNLFDDSDMLAGLVVDGSQKLFNRGMAIISAMKAASDLQWCKTTYEQIEGDTTRNSTYCHLVPLDVSWAEFSEFEEIFHVQGSGPLLWVGTSYDQQGNGKELVGPNGIAFASDLAASQSQSNPKTVYTILTIGSHPLGNNVEIQAGNGVYSRGSFPGSPQPDPELVAARVFTRVINRTLQSSNGQ